MSIFSYLNFMRSIGLPLCLLVMAGCGSSDPIGGGGGNGGSSECGPTTTVTGVVTGGQDEAFTLVESHDGKTQVAVAVGQLPLGDTIQFFVTVICPTPSFNGVSYAVTFSTSNPPSFAMSISYEESEIPEGFTENDLRLGRFVGGNIGWEELPFPDYNLDANLASESSVTTPAGDLFGLYLIEGLPGGGSAPTAPGEPTATIPNAGSCTIQVTWEPSTDVDGDLTSYQILRFPPNTPIGSVPAAGIGTPCTEAICSFTNSGGVPNLIAGTKYRYQIRAVDFATNTADSSVSSSVTAPDSCPNF